MTLIVADDIPEECIDGVKVISVGKPSSRIFRILRTTDRIFEVAIKIDADAYHLHDPELLIIASRLKKSGKKVVFDIHEETAKQLRIKPYLGRFFGFVLSVIYGGYERKALKSVDGVVAATQEIYENYVDRVLAAACVPNFVDIRLFQDRELTFDRPVLFHPGGLTRVRGLDNMVELAKKLGPSGDVLLAGPLSKEYAIEDLAPADYLGILSEDKLIDAFTRSNIGLILYDAEGQYGGATAIKLYEYMAARMPVILPDHGDWPKLNAEVKCGINVPVKNTEAVAEAVQWIMSNPDKAKDMGRRGRQFVEEYRSWDVSKKNLCGFYASLLC